MSGSGKPKAAHYRGTYHARSRRLTKAAHADPTTRCWRCNRTLAEVRQTKPKAIWTAGHLVNGQVDGPLAPECSPCNYSHGASDGNAQRKRQTPSHTTLRW